MCDTQVPTFKWTPILYLHRRQGDLIWKYISHQDRAWHNDLSEVGWSFQPWPTVCCWANVHSGRNPISGGLNWVRCVSWCAAQQTEARPLERFLTVRVCYDISCLHDDRHPFDQVGWNNDTNGVDSNSFSKVQRLEVFGQTEPWDLRWCHLFMGASRSCGLRLTQTRIKMTHQNNTLHVPWGALHNRSWSCSVRLCALGLHAVAWHLALWPSTWGQRVAAVV